jgi:hypothetical protein
MQYSVEGNDNARRFMDSNGVVQSEPGWDVNSNASNCTVSTGAPLSGLFWNGSTIDLTSTYYQTLFSNRSVDNVYLGLPNNVSRGYTPPENYSIVPGIGLNDQPTGFGQTWRQYFGITKTYDNTTFAMVNDAGLTNINGQNLWCMGMNFWPYGCGRFDAATVYTGGGDFAGYLNASTPAALSNVAPAYIAAATNHTPILTNPTSISLIVDGQNTRDGVPPQDTAACNVSPPGTWPCFPGWLDPLVNIKAGTVLTYELNPSENYVPGVSAVTTGSPSPGVGASEEPGPIVTAGQSVSVQPEVKNICTTCSATGGAATLKTFYYTASYNHATNTESNISSATAVPPVASTPTTLTNPASYPSGIGQGVTKKPTALPFVIPASTTSGTLYCFFSRVSPGKSDTTDDISPRFSNDDSPFPGSWDNTTNHTSNDICYDVENGTTTPLNILNLNVFQGDIHAGGGVTGACSLANNTVGNLKGSLGSYSQYVASSANATVGLATGSGSDSLSLGNDSVDGYYGVVCRPDMVQAATNYIHNHGGAPTGYLSGTVNSATLGGLNGIYQASGNITLSGGTINHPVTIYAPNGYTVSVTGNITYATSAAITALPSFGVIEQGGTIGISNAVTSIAGFYVAQQSSGSGGIINTCSGHTLNHVDCPNNLTIFGSLIANNILFYRTGPANGTGGTYLTESVTQAGVLYLSPPPAFATAPSTAGSLPQYLGEAPPLY